MQTDSPVGVAVAVADAVRLAASPEASGRASAQARRAWSTATPLVQGQAALLLDADGVDWRGVVEVEDGQPPRLPRTIALATLASAHADDWSEAEPAAAATEAENLLRRLGRAGYEVAGLEPFDVFAAAWMAGPANTADAVAQLLGRAEALLATVTAGDPAAAAALGLGRGLAAAGRRRAQLDRNGLIVPDEIRAATVGMSYSDITRETGAPSSSLSTWLHGTRRVTDAVALWMHERLEKGAPMGGTEKRRSGRPRSPNARVHKNESRT